MKINIIATIDIPTNNPITQTQINKAYEEFFNIIKVAHKNRDVTDFAFVNVDTNMEIEEEVNQ